MALQALPCAWFSKMASCTVLLKSPRVLYDASIMPRSAFLDFESSFQIMVVNTSLSSLPPPTSWTLEPRKASPCVFCAWRRQVRTGCYVADERDGSRGRGPTRQREPNCGARGDRAAAARPPAVSRWMPPDARAESGVGGGEVDTYKSTATQ